MKSHGEGKGGKVKANLKANVQLLQSVGGNEGKSLITPRNKFTISKLFLDGGNQGLHRGQLGGKKEGKLLVMPVNWSQWTLFFLSINCFIKRGI